MKQTVHYFLCCPHYQSQRNILFSEISEIICSDVIVLLNDHLIQILMYGSNVYIPNCNKLSIEQSILFIKSSGRLKHRSFFFTFIEPWRPPFPLLRTQLLVLLSHCIRFICDFVVKWIVNIILYYILGILGYNR